MRTRLFATIGAIWLAGTGVALSAPISAAAIGEAAEQLNITESVHCRPFRHWHRWGYSRGCGPRAYLDDGVRVRTRIGVRDGYRDRGYRARFRGGVFATGVTIRSEQRGGFRGGATVSGGGNVRRHESAARTKAVCAAVARAACREPKAARAGRSGGGGAIKSAPTRGGAAAEVARLPGTSRSCPPPSSNRT